MLAKAIDKILSLKDNRTYEIGGHVYSDNPLTRIDPPIDRPKGIEVNSLDSICKLIRKEIEKVGTTVMVRVSGSRTVEVFTTYLDDFSRNQLYTAKADVPDVRAGWRDHESALIELRSLFIPGEGTAYLLDLISRMAKDDSVKSADNGVTQTITATSGISLKASVEVKPRVVLQPFRTFLEVPQPESEFLLRIDEDGQIGLFEADGGVWKLEAKSNIADYLERELADLINGGDVIVMK